MATIVSTWESLSVAGGRDSEFLFECLVEALTTWCCLVLAVDRPDFLLAQLIDPCAVVQGLGHHVTWGPIAFQLKDVHVAVSVDAKDIYQLAGISLDLASKNHQGAAQQAGVGLDDVL